MPQTFWFNQQKVVTRESKFLNFPQVTIMGRFSNQTLYASESPERLIKIQFAGPCSSSLAFTVAGVGLEKLHFENISMLILMLLVQNATIWEPLAQTMPSNLYNGKTVLAHWDLFLKAELSFPESSELTVHHLPVGNHQYCLLIYRSYWYPGWGKVNL